MASRKLSVILNREKKLGEGHMSMGGSRRVSGIVCFCTQGWDICRKKALDGRDVVGQSQQCKYWRRKPARGSIVRFICGNMRNMKENTGFWVVILHFFVISIILGKVARNGFSFSLKTTKF